MGTTSGLTSYLPAATTATGTAATSGTAAGTSSATSLASNFNTFLSLLTTQLKNQDPSNPVDSNQFTQQLVEFAGVQQQVQSNTLLQQLVSNSQSNQVSSASSFVGTTVQATGNQTALSGGVAQIGYTLPSAASSAVVTIKDSSGQIVFTGQGTTTTGSNTVKWNGLNSLNGSQEPDGTYTVSVSAKDSAGNAVTATPYISGTVSSASITNGSVVLNIGGLQVPESSVTSVTNLTKS